MPVRPAFFFDTLNRNYSNVNVSFRVGLFGFRTLSLGRRVEAPGEKSGQKKIYLP